MAAYQQEKDGSWRPLEPISYGYAGRAQDGPWLRWILRRLFRR